MFVTLSEFKSRRFQKNLMRKTRSHGKMDRLKWARAVILEVKNTSSDEFSVSHNLLNTEDVQELVEVCHGGGSQ